MPTRRRISARLAFSTRQAADRHRAAGRRVDPVEGQHERRLAGAVRAEHGDPLAAGDDEVDAVERDVPVRVGEREVADLQRVHPLTLHAAAATAAAIAGQSRHTTHDRHVDAAPRTGIVPT